MLTGMEIAGPKLTKGGRNLKKAKHCTIPNFEQNNRKKASELEKLNLMMEIKPKRSGIRF